MQGPDRSAQIKNSFKIPFDRINVIKFEWGLVAFQGWYPSKVG